MINALLPLYRIMQKIEKFQNQNQKFLDTLKIESTFSTNVISCGEDPSETKNISIENRRFIYIFFQNCLIKAYLMQIANFSSGLTLLLITVFCLLKSPSTLLNSSSKVVNDIRK